MTMTSLLWRHLNVERSQSVQYFAKKFSFTTREVLNGIVSYKKSEQVQKANMFICQTLTFHFSTYRLNSFKHLSHNTPVRSCERIDCSDLASVVETTRRPGRFSSTINTFLTMSKHLHQTCIAGLVKYLSPYTGHISNWLAFALTDSPTPKKTNNWTVFLRGCSQRQCCHI